MTRTEQTPLHFSEIDYEYGSRNPLAVINFSPSSTGELDPHSAHMQSNSERPSFTEEELRDKVVEIAHNYTVISDPQSTEANSKQFGFTVVNKDKMTDSYNGILVPTTNASSLYDEEMNPNNEGNALELAYTALKYPELPIFLVESPGTGNSSDFDDEEYGAASKNGSLVEVKKTNDGQIFDASAFPTIAALYRALESVKAHTGSISANATAAHIATALAVASKPGTIERAFLYNPTNISDRTALGLIVSTSIEVVTQGRYKSYDPLALTGDRKTMAKSAMSDKPKRKIDQAVAQTHNPKKLLQQNQIWRRGDKHGQSAAVHAVASQLRHPDARYTYVLPQFAAQYKSPKDFVKFINAIGDLGGSALAIDDLKSLAVPLGQYGHSHFPSVRQTFESYAFER